jgi:MFS family permease
MAESLVLTADSTGGMGMRQRGRDQRPRFGDALADREFRALFGADLLSLLGDQMALLALIVVVHQRTGSAFLSAAVLAASFFPSLLGGPLLAAFADRLPRRRLMTGCDIGRALLVLLVALPLLPTAAVFPVVFAVGLVACPFEAARSALLPEILEGERYVAGLALMQGTYQVAQVAGYVAGGVAVAAFGPLPVLLVDVATFLASAAVLTTSVRPGYVVAPRHVEVRASVVREALLGARVVFGHDVLRTVMVLAWVTAMFGVVPEAVAAAYSDSVGGGSAGTGLLLAAPSLGAVVGMLLVGRFLPAPLRVRALRPLAVLWLAPLLVTTLTPPLPVVLAAWTVAGIGAGLQVSANVTFVAHTPPALRGRAFGLAQSGVAVVQGCGFLAAGALAQLLGPAATVTLAAGVGLLALVPLFLGWPAALTRGGEAEVRSIHLGSREHLHSS